MKKAHTLWQSGTHRWLARDPQKFHRRWMGSNEAKLDWCERVSRQQIDMLVPQHGAVYQGADVGRFIDWFAALPVGIVRPPATAHREAA